MLKRMKRAVDLAIANYRYDVSEEYAYAQYEFKSMHGTKAKRPFELQSLNRYMLIRALRSAKNTPAAIYSAYRVRYKCTHGEHRIDCRCEGDAESGPITYTWCKDCGGESRCQFGM